MPSAGQPEHRSEVRFDVSKNRYTVLIDGVPVAEVVVANRSAKVDIKIDFSESVEGTFADVTLRHDGSAQLKPLDIATKFPFHIKFIEIDTRTEAKQLRVPPVLATRLLKQEIESKIREFKALSPEHRLEQAGAALRTLRALVSDPFFAGADTEIAKKISAKAAEIEPKLAEFAQARKENVTTERTHAIGPAVMAGVTVEEVGGGPEDIPADVIAVIAIAAVLIAGTTSTVVRDPDLVRRQAEQLSDVLDSLGESLKAVPRRVPIAPPTTQPLPPPEETPKIGPEEGTDPVAPPVPKPDSKRRRRRKECAKEPCSTPLPIRWPTNLPLPPDRTLRRTSRGEREWEGIDRGAEQRRMSEEIADNRRRGIPPPDPCFRDDAEPNAPYDAHHAQPLYLGGEDARYNLCALRADRHQNGHPQLDNQISQLDHPIWFACKVCEGFLRNHSVGQVYEIEGPK